MKARVLAENGVRTWALVLDTRDEVVSAVEGWAKD